MNDFDVCIIGSGAGAAPVAYELSKAGYSVVVLEKGRWFKDEDFTKDELLGIREKFTPDLRDEQHILELPRGDNWRTKPTLHSGWNFWNGSLVGGSSNFMSGFFHRLKPVDFYQLSEFGEIEGANVVDWPISYADLEPYYDKVEKVIGVSGRVVEHPFQEPRSSKDFPFPPTQEHPIAKHIDKACNTLGYHAIPMPRAILSRPALDRHSCSYNGYCGSYGCSTGAKGSARAALIDQAVATGNCEVRTESMVKKISTNAQGKITSVDYFDKQGELQQVDAKIYVVACQAIETSRLLLNSTGAKHPNGLGNDNGQIGKNLLFAGGGSGSGRLAYDNYSAAEQLELKQFGTFINRSIQDWYVIDDKDYGERQKGGTVDFVHLHPNPIARASRQVQGEKGLVWGKPLKQKLKAHFTGGKYIKLECFCDWMPTDNTQASIASGLKDKWGIPSAKVRIDVHLHNLQAGWYLADKGATVLKQMGAENVVAFASGAPPTNLVAGGCRFGDDPKTSVLDKNCRSHQVENLYVTDGSFMPTGGSVPYTWTIYANAFRVADHLLKELGKPMTAIV
ncbi:GMC family oxidoreductase [Candidatus Albibeggiatoa sp. nov. NOAA]|uniref:GMC family oxidoreductase n=1 Tax=Candidatus Albibeggiatoa sp. nov. NOAA TaxID=3162724 RepID=UPI0033035755|nr:GMC family oxidoreductase [Thiotrichaceae bacterium]